MDEVTLGVRCHTGWAVVVAIGGRPASPTLVHRQRIELGDDSVPDQVYHAAQGLDAEAASALVARSEAAAAAAARRSLGDVVSSLRESGHHVATLGLVGEPHDLPPLEKVLASHALLHTAEGDLYQSVVEEAAAEHGLAVTMVPQKALAGVAADAAGVDEPSLVALVAGLGKPAGPPWRKDHKEATLAAIASRALRRQGVAGG